MAAQFTHVVEHGVRLMVQCREGPAGTAAIKGFVEAQATVHANLAPVRIGDVLTKVPTSTLCQFLALSGYFLTREDAIPAVSGRLASLTVPLRHDDATWMLQGSDGWALPHAGDHRLVAEALNAVPHGGNDDDVLLVARAVRSYSDLDVVPSRVDRVAAAALERCGCSDALPWWEVVSALRCRDAALTPVETLSDAVSVWPLVSQRLRATISHLPAQTDSQARRTAFKCQRWALTAGAALGNHDDVIASRITEAFCVRMPVADLHGSVQAAEALIPLLRPAVPGVSSSLFVRRCWRTLDSSLLRGSELLRNEVFTRRRQEGASVNVARFANKWLLALCRAECVETEANRGPSAAWLTRFRGGVEAATKATCSHQNFAGPLREALLSSEYSGSALAAEIAAKLIVK
jgi:hypothetical protein